MTLDHIWYKECIEILMTKYSFDRQDAVELANTFDEEQRQYPPDEALEEEFSYWGD